MAEETDGVGETFDEALRVALTVASQFGERIARLREQAVRDREARAGRESRELQNRFEAERGAARASLAVVDRPQWWDRATIAEISGAHETAIAWRDYDDVANKAVATIQREVQDRYGVDVGRAGADPRRVADALRQEQMDRAGDDEERRSGGGDLAAAEALLTAAERRDFEATGADQGADDASKGPPGDADKSRHGYDTAERREEFARSLVGKATEADIRARLLADRANAAPATAALSVATDGTTRSSRRSSGNERDRGGLSR
jgi:hypothetical protein